MVLQKVICGEWALSRCSGWGELTDVAEKENEEQPMVDQVMAMELGLILHLFVEWFTFNKY